MGGRLDATRICEPRVSTIVSIDRDHEAFLGTTLAAIAREKAGVLRRGCVTVIGPMVGEARTAIAARARRAGARLVVAERGASVHATARATTIRTSQHVYRIGTPLAPHQRHNALVAVRVLEEARRSGIPVDLGAVAPAFERAEWPGRLQWLPDRPPLLLDGAHNPAAAHALAEHLTTRGPFVLLFGMMADKDIEAVTRTLFPLARAVVVTRARDARAATPAEIVRRAGNAAAGIVRQSNPRHALAKARALARPGEVVVVAGSLYLVGEVLRLLR
jgi:dihydrofolate synthase/folylpolyglutamate synthase